MLSVNLSRKACYTAVNSRRAPSPGPKGHYLLPVITRRELLESTPRSALPVDAQAPIWNRLLTWVLLISLLYFVSNGNPFPASGDVSFRVAEASGSSASHRITVALMAILWVVLIFNRLPSVFAIAQRNKLIVALPLLALLSSVWSQNPRQTLVSGSIFLVFTIFALYVGSTLGARGQFELLMLTAAVALPISIALAVLVPGMGASGHAWRGIFAHKQNCAAVATILLVTALHWDASGMFQKTLRVSCAAMCCVMIVMSQSRTGWALALLALLLSASLWMLQKLRARDGIFLCLWIASAFAAAAYFIYSNAALLLPAVGKDATLSERTIIWSAAWATIGQHPLLGYGYGAFWAGLQGASLNMVLLAGWVLQQSQNGFLDLWLQVGVGGVVITALITVRAVWNAVHCFRSREHDRYVRWCIVMIVCALLYNIGESALGMVQMVWFIFLLACIGLRETVQVMPAQTHEQELPASQHALSGDKIAPMGWSST